MPGDRIEQRLRLRAEPPLSEATVLVRGGPDTRDKLARHAHRTARAWSLDGQPLLGISVFAVLDIPLDELLSARFATYRTIHMPTAARLLDRGFELAGDEDAAAVCQVVDLAPAGDGTIVQLRLLPGLVDDYRQLVERALAS